MRALRFLLTLGAGGLLAFVLIGGSLAGRDLVLSQLIALRLPITLGGAAAAVMLFLTLFRGHRRSGLICAAVVTALVIANGSVLVSRGLGTLSPAQAAAESAPTGSLRVLSWNTTPTGVSVARVARLVAQTGADIVALPEMRPTRAAAVAQQLRRLGHPMWVVPDSTNTSKYPISLLVTKALPYQVTPDSSATGEADGIRGGILAETTVSGMPEIAVVHAQQPGFNRSQATTWRAHLAWVESLCSSGRAFLILGDFNGTVDNLGTLTGCTSAAAQAGSGGATGTWPTSLPWWAGASIDHIFVTSGWRASSFGVISGQDTAGSDHRPIFAVLTPTS